MLLAGVQPQLETILRNVRFHEWLSADCIYPEKEDVYSASAKAAAVLQTGTSLSGVANRLVALEEFWTCRAAQLNLEQRASSNPA